MCRVIQVSRSGYYEWLNNPEGNRAKKDKNLISMIKLIFEEGRGNYGSRTIKKKLDRTGELTSRRRIIRLMRQADLTCKTKRKFKSTTDSKHNLPVAPNLLNRNFEIDQPNFCYVGDITYIATNEGWLYLATVIDLYSRKIVGWSMADNMKADLVNNALLMAIWQRKPRKGLIWHTDRGSQYASNSHLKIIRQHGIIQSMSRKGNCWDNAVAESFFHTLKNELIYQTKFKTREEAKNVIFEYIEVFYNRIRSHSNNDYLSPVEYENLQKIA
jgi:transposase InsO family protein